MGAPPALAGAPENLGGGHDTASVRDLDIRAQRTRGWALLASITHEPGDGPVLADWFSEAETFAADGQPPGTPRLRYPGLPVGASAPPERRMRHIADAPLITFVHYDRSAYRHIRHHRLHDEAQLERLARSGARDPDFHDLRAAPPLPAGARIFLSAWWPVAARGRTPLPVWDTGSGARPGGSNDYTSWRRIVAVSADGNGDTASISFAGRQFDDAARVGLGRFVRLPVDAVLARRLMSDTGARKAAVLVLGRPLAAGDFLVLVAFHLLEADTGKGVWATFWWHDEPGKGRFGNDRPDAVRSEWRHYLMDVTLDESEPREADGSPRICFNPWLEAKFPDGGQGNGLRSNCLSCHERASYPPIDPLPVRRGSPDPQNDPAFAPGRLRTARLWSIANPGQAGIGHDVPHRESDTPAIR